MDQQEAEAIAQKFRATGLGQAHVFRDAFDQWDIVMCNNDVPLSEIVKYIVKASGGVPQDMIRFN